MKSENEIILKWHGVSHYHIKYNDLTIVIDPIYQRAPCAKPVLTATRDDLAHVNYLLLTHGHVDHSWDFPYLASKHRPIAYAPRNYLAYLKRKESRWKLPFDWSTFQILEQVAGKPFDVADIRITPYRIGTESVDVSVCYQSVWRGFRHMAFGATSAGLKFLLNHLRGNCFAYHFHFRDIAKTLLYFGNVTDRVYDMQSVDGVDVLAIPYCPASRKWLAHTLYLIDRFKSEVILVHHYDNFWHPITHPSYRNLKDYQESILNSFPQANLLFSKFMEAIPLSDILHDLSNKKNNESPFDVPGIKTCASTKEILDAVKESRSRS